MSYQRQPMSGSIYEIEKEGISKKTGKPYKYFTGYDIHKCSGCGKVDECWVNAFRNTLPSGDNVLNYNKTLKKPLDGAQEEVRAEEQNSSNDIPF